MNKGTRVRTALRIAFSIYTAFCVWQVAISELSKQLNAPWLIGLCAVVIVVSGLLVDALTTYYNNDFTEVADKYTMMMRKEKARLKAEEDDEEDLLEDGDE